MKLTTQMTVIIVTAIAGLVAMVWFLSEAGWTTEGIIGMVTGIATAITLLIAAIRNQGHQAQLLEQLTRSVGIGQQDQADQLQTVVRQTNGMQDEDRRQLATDIADRTAAATVAELKNRGLL